MLPLRLMCTAALNEPAGGHARGRGRPTSPVFVNRPKRSTRGSARPGSPHPRRRAFTRTGASTVTALAQAIVSRAGRAAASAACWGAARQPGDGSNECGAMRGALLITRQLARWMAPAVVRAGSLSPPEFPRPHQITNFYNSRGWRGAPQHRCKLHSTFIPRRCRCRARRSPPPAGRPRCCLWAVSPASQHAESARGRSRLRHP